MSSWRPIAVGSTIHKIIFTIWAKRLETISLKKEWLHPHQYGFVKGRTARGAADVATNLIDKVSNLSYLGVGNGPYANTVWGAFNGISEFLSHQSGRNADNRMTSLWFGSNAGVLRRAHSEAMKLAA